ncbi:hypothetical protein BGZ60DRAFT_517965 [Tricladium varicosporioides]|nr:hypothetical protein BGZ60DRAFT_517965 [Hymenoscyphus varicosporioides]
MRELERRRKYSMRPNDSITHWSVQHAIYWISVAKPKIDQLLYTATDRPNNAPSGRPSISYETTILIDLIKSAWLIVGVPQYDEHESISNFWTEIIVHTQDEIMNSIEKLYVNWRTRIDYDILKDHGDFKLEMPRGLVSASTVPLVKTNSPDSGSDIRCRALPVSSSGDIGVNTTSRHSSKPDASRPDISNGRAPNQVLKRASRENRTEAFCGKEALQQHHQHLLPRNNLNESKLLWPFPSLPYPTNPRIDTISQGSGGVRPQTGLVRMPHITSVSQRERQIAGGGSAIWTISGPNQESTSHATSSTIYTQHGHPSAIERNLHWDQNSHKAIPDSSMNGLHSVQIEQQYYSGRAAEETTQLYSPIRDLNHSQQTYDEPEPLWNETELYNPEDANSSEAEMKGFKLVSISNLSHPYDKSFLPSRIRVFRGRQDSGHLYLRLWIQQKNSPPVEQHLRVQDAELVPTYAFTDQNTMSCSFYIRQNSVRTGLTYQFKLADPESDKEFCGFQSILINASWEQQYPVRFVTYKVKRSGLEQSLPSAQVQIWTDSMPPAQGTQLGLARSPTLTIPSTLGHKHNIVDTNFRGGPTIKLLIYVVHDILVVILSDRIQLRTNKRRNSTSLVKSSIDIVPGASSLRVRTLRGRPSNPAGIPLNQAGLHFSDLKRDDLFEDYEWLRIEFSSDEDLEEFKADFNRHLEQWRERSGLPEARFRADQRNLQVSVGKSLLSIHKKKRP